MRQKELRIALVCYGGVSLAVYMHGVTKEIWKLASASRSFHAGDPRAEGVQGVYRDLLEAIDRALTKAPDLTAEIRCDGTRVGLVGASLNENAMPSTQLDQQPESEIAEEMKMRLRLVR